MSDLASLRAEIKNWERTFKATEGRNPSVDDIKKLPHIAQKYKLYKQFSKAAPSQPVPPHREPSSSQPASQSPTIPTRPSRTRIDHASLATLSSRVITSTAPLSSFNPFSPQKAKGKEREKTPSQIPQPIFNPFASPSKPKPQAQSKKSLSQFTSLQSPERPPSPPSPPSAITRARKRLRGEAVSPSPSKEKRQRTGSQTTLNFPRLKLASKKQSLIEDTDHPREADEDAFVDDSPVKPSGGRKFNLLFDEAQSSTGADIFGLKKDTRRELRRDMFSAKDVAPKVVSRSVSSTSSQDEAGSPSSSRPHTRLTSPMEELDLFRENEHTEESVEGFPGTRRSKSPLLPPSPPPAGSTTTRGPAKGKRKADSKGLSNRKKMKLAAKGGSDEEGSTSDNSDLKAKVRIVHRPQVKKANVDDDDLGPDFDPVLDLTRAPRLDTISLPGSQLEEAEMVEINLPDKFKDVLDLDPTRWKDHDVEEDKLVKGLMYGRRVASYDPKRGEIWDVGEDEVGDEEKRQLIDDDWEGEPVPWEVAEL